MNEETYEPGLLSVVVPIYKVEGFLERCVDTLIAQTYENLQIILVDDGSPDLSGKICDDYAAADPRIEVIHKKNGGLSDARNAGIERARGEYIAFVDSDDYVHQRMYEVMIREMKEHDAQIASCGYYKPVMTLTDRPYRGCNVIVADHVAAVTEGMRWHHFDQCVWNKVFRRQLIKGIIFPVGKIHEDIFWTYKVMIRAEKIIHLDYGFYYYQQDRANSIMGKVLSEKNFDETEAILERIDYVRENAPELLDAAKICLFDHVFHFMTELSCWDDRPVSVRYPLFCHYSDVLANASPEIREPFCRISRRNRVKVSVYSFLAKHSSGLLFLGFGFVRKLHRKQKTIHVHPSGDYELCG